MKCRIRSLYGDRLGASDGDIGRVKDFYFDDQRWAVRYMVADTAPWLPDRHVLIPPHMFSGLMRGGPRLFVNLTRKQIEESPLLDSHGTVSRRFEVDYYRHYGLPFYWHGNGLWGRNGFPLVTLSPSLMPDIIAVHPEYDANDDPILRSTRAVCGCRIQAIDGEIGRICDYQIDDQNWGISHLVVKTGEWFMGKEVLIPPNILDRISSDGSTAFLNMTRITGISIPYRLVGEMD